MKKIILKDSKKGGHYSAGIISGDKLYISGQLPLDLTTGKVVGETLKEQTLQVLKNIEKILKEADLGLENVVQCRVYTTDIKNWGEIDEIYKNFFGEHKPARAVVVTKELHFDAKIEIEAIAEIEE